MNEAVLAVGSLDYLTCFDQAGAFKTWHAWWPELKVIMSNPDIARDQPIDCVSYYWRASLSPAKAGSLGEALSMCKFMGIASVDLFGVDLCWLGRPVITGQYAKAVLDNMKGPSFHGYSMHRVKWPHRPSIKSDDPDLWTDGAFLEFAKEIEEHVEAWDGLKVTNKSPISQLNAFPAWVGQEGPGTTKRPAIPKRRNGKKPMALEVLVNVVNELDMRTWRDREMMKLIAQGVFNKELCPRHKP